MLGGDKCYGKALEESRVWDYNFYMINKEGSIEKTPRPRLERDLE